MFIRRHFNPPSEGAQEAGILVTAAGTQTVHPRYPSEPPTPIPLESVDTGNSRILTRGTVTYTHTQSKYIGRHAAESDVSSDVVVACDVSSDGTTGTLQHHTCLGARSSNQTSIHSISEERVADKPEPIHSSSTIRNASYKMKRGPA